MARGYSDDLRRSVLHRRAWLSRVLQRASANLLNFQGFVSVVRPVSPPAALGCGGISAAP
jgi:hypothetical protein